MRHAIALPAALAATLLLLGACGGKSTVRQPATLETIEQPQVDVRVDWRNSRGPDVRGRDLGLGIERHEDAIFSADARGNVYALNSTDGSEIWRANTGARLSGGPSVEGDTVYIGTLDAEVIALSRADGSERWRGRVGSEVLAKPVSNGRAVAVRSVDGGMTALSATDGQRLWTTMRAVPPLTLRGGSPPVIVGSIVIFGLETGRIVAKRLQSGEAVWEQAVSIPSGRSELERIADINAPMLLQDSTLFAMSYGGDIAAIDISSGDVRWRRSVRSYTGAALGSDRIFVSDEAGAVWALDISSGAAAWKNEALAWRGLSAPAVQGDYVVVSDFEGYVHYLSRRSGEIVGRAKPLSERVQATPVVSDGRLIIGDRRGRLVSLSAEPR